MTVSDPNPEQFKALLSLTEDQFREQRIAVKIFSQVLGTEIYLISHPSLKDKVDGVAYLPEEIAELMKIRDALKPHYEERLRKIHDAKKIYGGKIISGESGG
ncbi:MAG: hypothetical protein AABY87_02325 [bacterium]